MSYITPVVINENVSSQAIMGLIMAFSSIVGLICDVLFAKVFRRRSFIFFIGLTLLAAFLFPFTMSSLPSVIPVFLLATGIWGVYYESLTYSNYVFIAKSIPIALHERAWAKLNVVKAIAWTVAPLVAAFLLTQGPESVYQLVIVSLFVASLMALIAKKSWSAKSHQTLSTPSTNLWHQLKVWRVLFTKVWPMLLFFLIMLIIDATFWSIGTLMAEDLKTQSIWGSLILTAYMLPSLLFSSLAIPAAKPFGKKRVSFLLGIGAGLTLITLGVAHNPAVIVSIVFLFASLSAIIWPEIQASFENYVARLGNSSIDMVGLQASAGSLAYIVGPIVAGFTAALIGNQLTFSLFGLILTVISVVLLMIVPRKIKMPQTELSQI